MPDRIELLKGHTFEKLKTDMEGENESELASDVYDAARRFGTDPKPEELLHVLSHSVVFG
jgi:hypothetical protein